MNALKDSLAGPDLPSTTDRGLSAVLYSLLAVFVALATHAFFLYIGHYPYWSIDDGLSVLSTSWLQMGRYGDPSVPIEGFSTVQRYRGFLNYGPWPFATGSAVIWLFGFSVPALRAVHLAAALVLTLVGLRLFTGLRGAIATTVLGASIAYAVVRIQWPMVRPDVFVTLFAAGLIASAAAATRRGRLRDWFACGLTAGCGALSHLIAASLVPASLVATVGGVAIRARAGGERSSSAGRFVGPVACLMLGWLAGAAMFYASIGFRFRDHFTVLLRYRSMVQGTAETALSSANPIGVWAEHWRIATSGVPGLYLAGVAVAMVLATALIGRALWAADARAVETVALLLPGWVILGLYVAGLAFYPNFHTGYVILPQLIGVWVLASTLYVVLGEVRRWSGRSCRFIEPAVALIVVLLVARSAYAMARTDDDPRISLARTWIGISSYVDEVLGPLPQRAIAWGAAPLAAEGPQRIQLVSLETALWLMKAIPPERRPALAPDYLVWGHPQSKDALVLPFTEAERDPLEQLPLVLPNAEFSLASIVAGSPYGATRVYQRRHADVVPHPLPAVSAWDNVQQRWLHDVSPVDGVTWRADTGVINISKGNKHWSRQSTAAVTAELPLGWYLFRVALTGVAPYHQLMTAGTGTTHDYPTGDLPPSVDVAAQLAAEPVYLLQYHDGGLVGLNLFADEDEARIGEVDTFRITGLRDYRLTREQMAEQPLPPLSAWVPDTAGGVSVVSQAATLSVSGNASQWGYQLVSPRIDVTPGADASIRLPVMAQAGRVCTGVLDERQQQWLVRPSDRSELHRFTTGANTALFVVVSNCYEDAGTAVASRFTVGEGRYAVFADRWYVDALMREFEQATR